MPAGATVIVKTQKIVVNPRTRQVAVINAGPQGPQGAPGPGGKNDYIRADGTVPMLSDLILPANPIDALAAIPKSYLENYAYDKAAADGRYIESAGDTMNGPLTIMSAASPATPNGLFFGGSRVHQMLNLYQTSYGIGVQSSAMYFRTGGTAQDFCWFQGGVHSDTNEDAGAGGRVAMVLRPDGLYLPDVNVTNLVIGNSASSGPRIRLHVPTTGDIVYLDFAGNGAAGTESMYFRAGTTQVFSLEDTLAKFLKPLWLVTTGQGLFIQRTDADGPHLGFYNTDGSVRNGYIQCLNSAAGGMVVNPSLGPLRLYAVGAEAGRFISGGDFLVGKTAIDADANGLQYQANFDRLWVSGVNGYNFAAVHLGAADANGQRFLECRRVGGVGIGSITQVNTTGVAFNTTSHGPFKGEVQDLDDDEAIARVELWRPVSFRWKFDETGTLSETGTPGGEVDHGFIAQELNEVQPSAVTPGEGTWAEHLEWQVAIAEKVAIDRNNIELNEAYEAALVAYNNGEGELPELPELQSVPDVPIDSPFTPWVGDWSKLVPDLTAALQAVIRQNRALTARVDELERMVR
jgi:hypothetical protein